MHEILYILRAIVIVFASILVYGIVSLLIVSIDYGFAEPFIDVGILLFLPVTIFLPGFADWAMTLINMLEMNVSDGNGIFLVLFMLVIVFIYTAVLESIYQWLKGKDKKRYEFQI